MEIGLEKNYRTVHTVYEAPAQLAESQHPIPNPIPKPIPNPNPDPNPIPNPNI